MSGTTEQKQVSPVEVIKVESNFLRGEMAAELLDGTDHFGKESVQLMKHHGFYQQDDRDARKNRRGEGKAGKAYMFMVRTKIPGGKLTSSQLLAELDLCDEVANSTLRVTSRQGLQLHGVMKEDLKRTIRRINEVQLSTLAACGDVERNVMCCPAPLRNNAVHDQLQTVADQIAAHLCPRTRAYHELWLTDQETGEESLAGGGSNGHEVEPIYGPTYLPRKFKTAVGFPDDNCVDLYANDLGLMAVVESGKLIGFNVLVGGGMGTSPTVAKCFPAVAHRLAFITPDQVLDVATAIVKVQRDFGNREDRKLARMKYLIANWGLPKFRAKVEEYYGAKLPDLHPVDVSHVDEHVGWREQGDGNLYYGLSIESGRIRDEGDFRLKAALRKICTQIKPNIRLTPEQSILFTDVAPAARPDLEGILREHGVPLSEKLSPSRRRAMACVAWPTCGLSITEAERSLPGIMDQLDMAMAKLGLLQETVVIHMTGCPNGCARPYNSEIGLVGKTAGKYTVFVGGSHLGHRLNFIYQDLVPEEDVVPTITHLLSFYKANRQPGEKFGDFCHRLGADKLPAFVNEAHAAANGSASHSEPAPVAKETSVTSTEEKPAAKTAAASIAEMARRQGAVGEAKPKAEGKPQASQNGKVGSRSAQLQRTTGETSIELELKLDGIGQSEINTGVGFLDHMLTLWAKHGLFDLKVKATGDLHVDQHHTVEDVGICLGQALRDAVGDKAGIARYGHFTLPMEDSLATVAVDLSGRHYFVFEVEFPTEKIGQFDSELVEEFWRSVSLNAGCNLHIVLHHGHNSHHISEAIFKSAARAMRMSVTIDPRVQGIPSTKGTL